VLGFLDLQTRRRTAHTDLEDWLSTTVSDMTAPGAPRPRSPAASAAALGELKTAIEKLREAFIDRGQQGSTTAMANLAEAIQGLVHHMRTEQQMIRDWADAQASSIARSAACSKCCARITRAGDPWPYGPATTPA
jgi:hypothetical protein